MILIDHQPLQFAGVQNIHRTLLVDNVVGLAKTARVFGVPTILTTVLEQRGGYLIKDIQDGREQSSRSVYRKERLNYEFRASRC